MKELVYMYKVYIIIQSFYLAGQFTFKMSSLKTVIVCTHMRTFIMFMYTASVRIMIIASKWPLMPIKYLHSNICAY